MTKPFSEEEKQQWRENILKQQTSGFSIARWCRENNIAIHAFFYWRDKLFPKTQNLTRSTFTELKEEENTGIVIEYKNIRIKIEQRFCPSLLRKCLEVLKEIKC